MKFHSVDSRSCIQTDRRAVSNFIPLQSALFLRTHSSRRTYCFKGMTLHPPNASPKLDAILMKLFPISYGAWFALACTVAAPLLHADEWDRRTIVTFRRPVEIPRVVLGPGTYVVKLVDSSSERNIVQFLNEKETRVFATVLAIPDYRSIRAITGAKSSSTQRPQSSAPRRPRPG